MKINFFYDKVIDNYNNLSKIHKIAAVLKSNAYGYNIQKVGEKILQNTNCSIFFVNNIQEGIILWKCNKNHKKIQIFILYPYITTDDYEVYLKYNFIPLIQSYSQLNEHKIFFQKSKNVGIFVDTGLYRIGFEYSILQEILQKNPSYFKDINIIHVMSHLKERSDFSDLAYFQKYKFDKIIKYFPNATKSLIASSGLNLPKEFYYDFARVGGGLFGHSILKNCIFNLIGKIIYTKKIDNNYVGYGYKIYIKNYSNIGIVNISYNKGINVNRLLGRYIYIPRLNKKYQIVSTSMEYITINFEDDMPIVGEDVHFISNKNTLQELINKDDNINEIIINLLNTNS
ncbi:hypothetical protein AB836_00750 [Rickettsiales bacterium (ex Bugula neritina AB1)]|nr:hypothetical protein AB836_00750 [Rickettsiales bacterium (ex Bugula neritina AB1)]